MAEHKECKHYEDCCYRNDIGRCPNWCAQFEYKDEVVVVRCKDCKHYTEGMAIGMCKRDPERPLIPIPYNHYCGFAERKEDGKE